MLEFNNVIKQGDTIYSGQHLNLVKSIGTDGNVLLDMNTNVSIDNIRSVELSYLRIYLNIIKYYKKNGFSNVILDLHYNIGLSDFTRDEFNEFYKTNRSDEELYKHMKYLSFSDKNPLGLTAHPLVQKYLKTFHLNFYYKENITTDLLDTLLLGMENELYGDLFKPITEPIYMYKDTKFITDVELRKNKISKLVSDEEK